MALNLSLCMSCKQVKPKSRFDRDNNKRTGYSSWCKNCKRANSDKISERGKKRAKQCKLNARNCQMCLLAVNEYNLFLFEWDHINPANKKYSIGKMQRHKDKHFYAELQKCRLLCRDCHRAHTRTQHLSGVFSVFNTQLDLDYNSQLKLFEAN